VNASLSPCSELQASKSMPPSVPCSEEVSVKKFADLTKMIVRGKTQPDWKLKKHVKTMKKLENYTFINDEMFKQNNKAKCQICINSDHEMRAKYTDICSCGYAYCLRRHRAYVCCDPRNDPKKQQVKLYVKGKCTYSHLVSERSKKNRLTKDKGIAPSVKAVIQRILKENIEITPKMCHLMLIKGGQVNSECMPFLHQVYLLLFFLLIGLFVLIDLP